MIRIKNKLTRFDVLTVILLIIVIVVSFFCYAYIDDEKLSGSIRWIYNNIFIYFAPLAGFFIWNRLYLFFHMRLNKDTIYLKQFPRFGLLMTNKRILITSIVDSKVKEDVLIISLDNSNYKLSLKNVYTFNDLTRSWIKLDIDTVKLYLKEYKVL